MAEHPVVVDPDRGVTRRDRHQEVVEVRRADRRAALDQLQVVRREHRDPHDRGAVLHPSQCLAVHLHAVAPDHVDLGLEPLHALTVDDLGSHDRNVAPGAHERGVGDTPEGRAGRGPRDRFEQAGLALRVGPRDHGDPRGELESACR